MMYRLLRFSTLMAMSSDMKKKRSAEGGHRLKTGHCQIRGDVLEVADVECVYFHAFGFARRLCMDGIEERTTTNAPLRSALDEFDTSSCRESMDLERLRQIHHHLCRVMRVDLQSHIARQRGV